MPKPTWFNDSLLWMQGDLDHRLLLALTLSRPTTIDSALVSCDDITGFITGLEDLGFERWSTVVDRDGFQAVAGNDSENNVTLVAEGGRVIISPVDVGYLVHRTYAEPLAKALRDLSETHLRPPEKTRTIRVVVSGPEGGLELCNMGVPDAKALDERNYGPSVCAGFRYVAAQIQATDPNGRIVLLEGPPGTGKTFFVRALLHEATDANYILIPPTLLGEIASPTFLKVLLALRAGNDDPIVLVMEDADAALVPRASDNMSTISTILNMTDGILGSLLDVRVIATSNARRTEVDKALLRRGRLLKHIHVGLLETQAAERRLVSLAEARGITGRRVQSAVDRIKGPMAVGDVYGMFADLVDGIAEDSLAAE